MTRALRYLGIPLALLLAGTSAADDSELFLSDRDAAATRANVLFIIDTSGSMNTLVATQAPWNPTRSFPGCYDEGALYFSTNGAIPACDNPDFVRKSARRCASGEEQFRTNGYFSDFLLSWNQASQRWEELSSNRPDEPVECESDRGIDGDDGGGEPFAANGPDGPWDFTDDNEPAWTTRYTVYDGNWLNWKTTQPTDQRSRIDIVKDGVAALIGGLKDVNIGLMRFNDANGGSVVAPLRPIETSREAVLDAVDALSTGGPTPLSETLYEAGQYFAGRTVEFGAQDPVRSVAGARVGNDPDGNAYQSPITEACGKNFIILLTDGEPFNDSSADTRIRNLPGFSTEVGPDCDGTGDGRCLDDMASYLLRRDLDADVDGVQNVITHTIGFNLDFPLLATTASRGGGEYHLADDTATLATALSGIVLSIFDNAGTFAAPAVPVNAFNRTQNLSDVFLSVFQPTANARWIGNLKKFRLLGGRLVGQDGEPAIDTVTGLFSRDAFSFWSAEVDGDRAGDGGAASRLPEAGDRLLYTDLSGNDLAAADNRVGPDNDAVRAALTSVPTDDERRNVLRWALGQDVRDADDDGDTDETRRDMGDALHVQPVTLFYRGTLANPTATVFLATNDGFLHAIDTETGVERWAFVPSRLLNALYPLYRDELSSGKRYGLDGELNLVILDQNAEPGLQGGERAVLLFGMGRGGNGVFALDVTDIDEPRLLWRISGQDEQFLDLGYTWSVPQVARVRIGGTTRDVAVFGGGYDPVQDERDFRTDTIGRAIYMVDLLSGARLWSAGNADTASGPHDLLLAELQHSIPARVRPLDVTGDGLADRMYVGDMGGRVWRFDIRNGEDRADLVTGGVLASLGGAAEGDDPPAASLRRFYEAPDIVPLLVDRTLVLSINLGSGYRGHPLDTTIDEAFFSIRDRDVFNVRAAADYAEVLTLDDLVDITDDPTPTLLSDVAGWRLRLVEGAGEKVLGESVTLDNTTFFTSFTPGETPTACTSGAGVNRLYVISTFDARPRTNFDSPVGEPLTTDDRFRFLLSGIPIGDVTTVRGVESGDNAVCVGTECVSTEELGFLADDGKARRTYWFQNESP